MRIRNLTAFSLILACGLAALAVAPSAALAKPKKPPKYSYTANAKSVVSGQDDCDFGNGFSTTHSYTIEHTLERSGQGTLGTQSDPGKGWMRGSGQVRERGVRINREPEGVDESTSEEYESAEPSFPIDFPGSPFAKAPGGIQVELEIPGLDSYVIQALKPGKSRTLSLANSTPTEKDSGEDSCSDFTHSGSIVVSGTLTVKRLK